MTREEAGRRGREIAARARAQKSEYYTDGNTVRHIKPQNRITNPYISKDKKINITAEAKCDSQKGTHLRENALISR